MMRHSPAPFRLQTGPSGHLILDALGDSIAALALRTGDHDEAEQLANAQLLTAAPIMLDTLQHMNCYETLRLKGIGLSDTEVAADPFVKRIRAAMTAAGRAPA